jgi:hypothetical protein
MRLVNVNIIYIPKPPFRFFREGVYFLFLEALHKEVGYQYKENTLMQRFLRNLPEKYIPSLFIAKVVSGDRWPEVFAEVFFIGAPLRYTRTDGHINDKEPMVQCSKAPSYIIIKITCTK